MPESREDLEAAVQRLRAFAGYLGEAGHGTFTPREAVGWLVERTLNPASQGPPLEQRDLEVIHSLRLNDANTQALLHRYANSPQAPVEFAGRHGQEIASSIGQAVQHMGEQHAAAAQENAPTDPQQESRISQLLTGTPTQQEDRQPPSSRQSEIARHINTTTPTHQSEPSTATPSTEEDPQRTSHINQLLNGTPTPEPPSQDQPAQEPNQEPQEVGRLARLLNDGQPPQERAAERPADQGRQMSIEQALSGEQEQGEPRPSFTRPTAAQQLAEGDVYAQPDGGLRRDVNTATPAPAQPAQHQTSDIAAALRGDNSTQEQVTSNAPGQGQPSESRTEKHQVPAPFGHGPQTGQHNEPHRGQRDAQQQPRPATGSTERLQAGKDGKGRSPDTSPNRHGPRADR